MLHLCRIEKSSSQPNQRPLPKTEQQADQTGTGGDDEDDDKVGQRGFRCSQSQVLFNLPDCLERSLSLCVLCIVSVHVTEYKYIPIIGFVQRIWLVTKDVLV